MKELLTSIVFEMLDVGKAKLTRFCRQVMTSLYRPDTHTTMFFLRK